MFWRTKTPVFNLEDLVKLCETIKDTLEDVQEDIEELTKKVTKLENTSEKAELQVVKAQLDKKSEFIENLIVKMMDNVQTSINNISTAPYNRYKNGNPNVQGPAGKLP